MQRTLCATTEAPAARFASPGDMPFQRAPLPAAQPWPPGEAWAGWEAALHQDRDPLPGPAL
jgi:hypothetical protein